MLIRMSADSPFAPRRAQTRRERRRMAEGAVPRILTVCTGNICRSPLAEALLRQRLSDLPVEVHSAGTHALVGHGMTTQTLELAAHAGVDPAIAQAHRARYLVEPMLNEADLVLTMTREHRDVVLQMTPGKLRQVVPLREFARLAEAVPDERILAAAAEGDPVPSERVRLAVASVAGTRTAAATADDDVVDPFRQSSKVYEQAAAELLPAVAQVERVIRLALG